MVDLQENGISQDITGDMTPAPARRYSQKRTDTILKAAQTRLVKVQKRYKANAYKPIRFTPNFSPGIYVHVDRPPGEKLEAEDIAAKILSYFAGPYHVLQSKGHTFTLDCDRFQDVVSTEHVFLATCPQRTTNPQRSLQTNMAPTHTSLKPSHSIAATAPYRALMPRYPEVSLTPFKCTVSADNQGPRVSFDNGYDTKLSAETTQRNCNGDFHHDKGHDTCMTEHHHQREYVVDFIVSAGFGDDREVLYKVRWFGYGPEAHKWELRENVPQNFINRYWSGIGHTNRNLKERRVHGHMFSARPPAYKH